jgi:hypothetical protein
MPTIQLLLAALVVLNGAYAKQKAYLTEWENSECFGHPVDKQHKLKRDHCVNFSAGSFKIHPYKKKHDIDCNVYVYASKDCSGEYAYDLSTPEEFGKCNIVSSAQGLGAGSVKLQCPKHKSRADNDTSPATATITSPATATITSPATATITSYAAATVTSYVVPSPSSDDDTIVGPRTPGSMRHNKKLQWMKHPFAGSAICYECFTKKENNFDKFECYSSARGESDCNDSDSDSDLPTPFPPLFDWPTPLPPVTVVSVATVLSPATTSTYFESATRTITMAFESDHPALPVVASTVLIPVTTSTYVESSTYVATTVGSSTYVASTTRTMTMPIPSAQPLPGSIPGSPLWPGGIPGSPSWPGNSFGEEMEKRGDKKTYVTFWNPWFHNEVACGKAKWKHEGKKNAQVVIEKKKSKKCKGNAANLDLFTNRYTNPQTVIVATTVTVPYVAMVTATTTAFTSTVTVLAQ